MRKYLLMLFGVLSLLVASRLEAARDFDFENSLPEYKILRETLSGRIIKAADLEEYQLAAKLSAKLLGDYPGAIGFLKKYFEGKKESVTNWDSERASRDLAIYYAHVGDFDNAEKWLAKTGDEPSSYWHDKTMQEIEKCRKFLPLLEEKITIYRKNPDGDRFAAVIRAYIDLDEYGPALAAINHIQKNYPDHAWLKSREYKIFNEFLSSYITTQNPPKETSPSKIVPKTNPRVEAIFQDLHKIEQDRWEFCRDKWNKMSPIEKAKYVNSCQTQEPVMGFDWNPTESEAEEFLRKNKISWERRHQRENLIIALTVNWYLGKEKWEDEMIHTVQQYLSKEEENPFCERGSQCIEKLTALGKEAIPDLIACFQDVSWSSPEGREAQWAQNALSMMGGPALPALQAELEKILNPQSSGYVPTQKQRWIIKSVAGMKNLQAIPVLKKALELEDSDALESALNGLDNLEGGLSEDFLLSLWQNKAEGAGYLQKYGGEKTIQTLEKDLPTAYAGIAYDIRITIWYIRNRLGQTPNPEPQRIIHSKGDPSPLWEGIEKSIESPNPGIRLKAVKALWMRKTDLSQMDAFLNMFEKDPDPRVRDAAFETLHSILSKLKTQDMSKDNAQSLRALFHRLMETAKNGDDAMKAKILRLGYNAKDYEAEPDFPEFCRLIIEGIQSENIKYRSSATYTLVAIFNRRNDLVEKYISKKIRPKIERNILSDLDSVYGRLKVDAISAAEILKMASAQDKLLRIASGDEAHHRMNALESLEKIADSSALNALEEIMTKDPYADEWGLYRLREKAWLIMKNIRVDPDKAQE